MKKIFYLLIAIAFLTACNRERDLKQSRTLSKGRFPYSSITQVFQDDSIKTTLGSDTVQINTNFSFINFNVPLLVNGDTVAGGGGGSFAGNKLNIDTIHFNNGPYAIGINGSHYNLKFTNGSVGFEGGIFTSMGITFQPSPLVGIGKLSNRMMFTDNDFPAGLYLSDLYSLSGLEIDLDECDTCTKYVVANSADSTLYYRIGSGGGSGSINKTGSPDIGDVSRFTGSTTIGGNDYTGNFSLYNDDQATGIYTDDNQFYIAAQTLTVSAVESEFIHDVLFADSVRLSLFANWTVRPWVTYSKTGAFDTAHTTNAGERLTAKIVSLIKHFYDRQIINGIPELSYYFSDSTGVHKVYGISHLDPWIQIQALMGGIEMAYRYILRQWIENKMQWFFIILLIIGFVYQQIQIRKLKK